MKTLRDKIREIINDPYEYTKKKEDMVDEIMGAIRDELLSIIEE